MMGRPTTMTEQKELGLCRATYYAMDQVVGSSSSSSSTTVCTVWFDSPTKGGWCVGLTTLPPSCADCLEIWEPQTPGTLRASLRL